MTDPARSLPQPKPAPIVIDFARAERYWLRLFGWPRKVK